MQEGSDPSLAAGPEAKKYRRLFSVVSTQVTGTQDQGGGGGVEKKVLVPAYSCFFGGGGSKKMHKICFRTPKPEISSTLPHLFGFGRCKEDIFQGNH